MYIPYSDGRVSLVNYYITIFYAHREKIDAISGIKEPGYADLDSYLGELDSFNACLGETNQILYGFLEHFKKKDRSKDDSAKLLSKTILFIEDLIRCYEIGNLKHSLGDPDMSQNSKNQYLLILSVHAEFEPLNKLFEESTYRQKLAFFAELRQWCNNNPETEINTDNFYSTALTIIKSN